MKNNDDAERELQELRQAVLDDWIIVTTTAGADLQQMKTSLSWRVTKPLRLARRFQSGMREYGFSAATELAAAEIAAKLRRG